MEPLKRRPASKPFQNFPAFQPGILIRQKRMIRRMRILPKIGDKTMFLRIAVNIVNNML